ncbi:MAG: hypothetical protein A3H98_07685 [Bacteroidetes bacterium RIFCSPLOWO2_02_FULL_36_8]|nr:MAG: hypothetical protein A3H98_07685 [Bacteroidetes bacterium RIFCSPLOWO2_02_FULL_36_8]OFY71986.1 MAG: hypothetical protein A3G23_00125 [Bacteroidetes bacterium RIFCSPLOWO2_12_FULL_37_12]
MKEDIKYLIINCLSVIFSFYAIFNLISCTSDQDKNDNKIPDSLYWVSTFKTFDEPSDTNQSSTSMLSVPRIGINEGNNNPLNNQRQIDSTQYTNIGNTDTISENYPNNFSAELTPFFTLVIPDIEKVKFRCKCDSFNNNFTYLLQISNNKNFTSTLDSVELQQNDTFPTSNEHYKVLKKSNVASKSKLFFKCIITGGQNTANSDVIGPFEYSCTQVIGCDLIRKSDN